MSEENDTELFEVELFVATGAAISLRETRGFLPRGTFASWERALTEYYGVVPNERLAYRVKIPNEETGELYSVVLVFSGAVVKIGHDVVNGMPVRRAPGI